MTVELFNPETKDVEKIKEIRSMFYRRDESTLSYREKERLKSLMFMLSDEVSQERRDQFLLHSRENDIHWKKTQNRLEKLDIFNLEELSKEFGVKFTHLNKTFKTTTEALTWLKDGEEGDESWSFQDYENDFLEPCNRRWAFLGDFNDLAHYFAIRASNKFVFRRRIEDHDFVVTVTEDVQALTRFYLKTIVDAPDEETYQKIATTFIMGYTV